MAHRMEELIGIPFPNHSSDVLCCLNEQRRDGLLCDVVLIVRDQEYRTHRSILAACSQYFKKLFTVSNDGGGGHPTAVYEIDFVAPESLTAILEFAYTSTLTVTTSNVKEILSAARMFEIPCIVNVCLEIMDSGGERDGRREEEEDEDEEDLEADEDDEEDEEEGDDVEEARKDVQEDHGDATSERSTRSSESRVGSSPTKQVDSPPCTSQYQTLKERTSKNTGSIWRKPSQRDSMESRTLKDFSIESLLQEGLYPRIPVLDRSSSFSPLLPGFYSPMWASEFPGISQHIMEAGHSLHPSHPPYPAQPEACPLNLAVKREVIKEELKDDVQSNLLHGNFLKDFVSSGLAMVGTGGADGHLAQVKDETDFRSYMGFLSASHLGALFPPWQLEEERKMKPKASQQCPICNKIIQGAGKLPRHMRTHTGEKPYMCTICEVRFTRQDKLKIHMRKHTGERPYICLHCNSKFVHNYDLKNHLRIHTGVRPYQCEHCYKSFTRSDHLHRHIKRQSCRVSRPRRGRKPAAWRQAKSFLCPPAPPSSCHTEENGLPGRCRVVTSASSSSPGVKGHKGKEMHGLGSRGVAYKDFDSESRGTREGMRVERKHVMEEGGRPRGVFTFGLAGGEEVLHPQFYSTAADPWTMRLDRAPPIPEPAN